MRFIRNLLIIILVAKAISLIMLWYFQSEGVNHHPNTSKTPKYQKYNANNFIKHTKRPDIKQATEPTSQEAQELATYGPNISNMVLKGLFQRKDGGMVIIALKSKPNDSDVIGINDIFQGYTLKKVLKNGALFMKGGQTYSLYFSEEKQEQRYSSRPSHQNAPEEDEGSIKQVSKNDILSYAKNPKQIWKDIGIVEVKKKGKILGFKVTRIKANTPFARLGLRKNDLIIKANNKTLTSYKDAINIYKGIDKLEALELVVIRNNKETEINYEIY